MSDAFLGSRLEYARQGLRPEDLLADPVAMLQRWLEDAQREEVLEPTAMCLATADEHGFPSARMVLLRGLDGRGLTFYTNYLSRKGQEIEANPQASVCFWWGALERQVRVEGRLERVSPEESDAYFRGRPRASQWASAQSPQSQPVDDHQALEQRLKEVPAEGEIVRPEHWGGYRLVPKAFEFWQGRPARVHDRFRYEQSVEGWLIVRLAP